MIVLRRILMKIKLEVELDTDKEKDAALLAQLMEILEDYKEGCYNDESQ